MTSIVNEERAPLLLDGSGDSHIDGPPPLPVVGAGDDADKDAPKDKYVVSSC